MWIIFFMILSAVFNIANAQTKSKGIVHYGHMQSMGMGGPIGVDYNSILIFDDVQSTYIFAKDSLEGGGIRTSITIANKDNRKIMVPKNTSPIGFVYNLNTNNGMLKSRDLGFKYTKEKRPKINWLISNEHKKIGQFNCQKAEAEFRGREYSAWFTTEIPLPYGPWKLNGLPGMILEAYDTDKEVYFYFKSVKYPNEEIGSITAPKPEIENKEWITFPEYKLFLINSYNRAIQNTRMVIEQANIYTLEDKRNMKDSYIEVFQD